MRYYRTHNEGDVAITRAAPPGHRGDPVAVVAYVAHRLRAAPARWLAGALGVATATAGFLVAIFAPSVAGDLALRHELGALSVPERSISLVAIDRADANSPEVDTFVRSMLSSRGFDDVRRETLLRQLAAPDGTVYRLIGVDDLASAVDVVDGRLPTTCTPTRCEVVVWARPTSPSTVSLDSAMHVDVVGTVMRRDERVASGSFTPGEAEVVVFADGSTATEQIKALELFQRTTGWVTTIDPARVTIDDIPTILGDIAELGRPNPTARLSVTAPDDELRSIARRARVTTNRLALPIGQSATILGGFAMLTALAIRPWHQRGLRVLRLRGARRRHLRLYSALESGAIVGVGLIGGLALATVGGRLIARSTASHGGWGLAFGAVRDHPLACGAVVGIYWLVSTALLHTETRPARRRTRIAITDVVGVAAVAVWVLAAGRSSATSATLAQRTDPLLALTPAFAVVAAGCLVVRFLPVVAAMGRRVTPARWWPVRVALSSVRSHDTRPLTTAAFLAGALTLATFAFGYRSTLQVSARDQAAYAVPLDFIVDEGPRLIRPQTVMPTATWATRTAGVQATDVLRRGFALRTTGTGAQPVSGLGIDPDALALLRGWRSDFGHRPDGRAIAVAPPAAHEGVAIPDDARVLTVTTTPAPPGMFLSMVVEGADGSWEELSAAPDTTGTRWTAPLAAGTDDRWFHGVRIGESVESSRYTEHNVAEGTGTAVSAFAIDITLQSVSADDRRLSTDLTTLTSPETTVTPTPDGARLQLVEQGHRSMVLFGPTAGSPIPAIVDPVTASTARNGIVTLESSGQTTLDVRVVGTARTFPSVGERFVITDVNALSRALNRLQPGSGSPNEQWLAADDAESRRQLADLLATEQFAPLEVSSRVGIERQLSGDTLARTVVMAFLWSSLIAALLGAAALVYVTAADRMDDRPLLRSLAADGARPRQLVAVLLVRSGALLIAAVPIGVTCGSVLLHAVRELVVVSATGSRPVPDLRSVYAMGQLIPCLVGVTLISLGGAWLVSRSAGRIRRHEALAAPT